MQQGQYGGGGGGPMMVNGAAAAAAASGLGPSPGVMASASIAGWPNTLQSTAAATTYPQSMPYPQHTDESLLRPRPSSHQPPQWTMAADPTMQNSQAGAATARIQAQQQQQEVQAKAPMPHGVQPNPPPQHQQHQMPRMASQPQTIPRSMPQQMTAAQRNLIMQQQQQQQQRMMAQQQQLRQQQQQQPQQSVMANMRPPSVPQQNGSPVRMPQYMSQQQQQQPQQQQQAMQRSAGLPQTPMPASSPGPQHQQMLYRQQQQMIQQQQQQQAQQARARAAAQMGHPIMSQAQSPHAAASFPQIQAQQQQQQPQQTQHQHVRSATPASRLAGPPAGSPFGPSPPVSAAAAAASTGQMSPQRSASVTPHMQHALVPTSDMSNSQPYPHRPPPAPSVSSPASTPPQPAAPVRAAAVMPTALSRVTQCIDHLSDLISAPQTTMADMSAFVQEYFVPDPSNSSITGSSSNVCVKLDMTRPTRSEFRQNSAKPMPEFSFPPIVLASLFISMRAAGMKHCRFSMSQTEEFAPLPQKREVRAGHLNMMATMLHHDDPAESANSSSPADPWTSCDTVTGHLACRLVPKPIFASASAPPATTWPEGMTPPRPQQPIIGSTWCIEHLELVFQQQFMCVDRCPPWGAEITGSDTTSAPDLEAQQTVMAKQWRQPSFLDQLRSWMEMAPVSVSVAQLMLLSDEQNMDPLELLSRYEPLGQADQSPAQHSALEAATDMPRPQSAFEPQHASYPSGLSTTAGKRKVDDVDGFLQLPPSPNKFAALTGPNSA